MGENDLVLNEVPIFWSPSILMNQKISNIQKQNNLD
jgi:hypothetical protein